VRTSVSRGSGDFSCVRPLVGTILSGVSNEAASALAKKRWKNTTAAERSEIASALGKASNAALTAEQRSERARNAVNARWARKKRAKKTAKQKK